MFRLFTLLLLSVFPFTLAGAVIASSPEHMAAMNKAEIARWTPIVKASGAKID